MKKCDYVGFEIINNLMSPIFVVGDVVLLDKSQMPKSGECGGFMLNGGGYICEYKEKRGKKYLLFGKNKIKIKSTDCFEIIGRVKSKFFKV